MTTPHTPEQAGSMHEGGSAKTEDLTFNDPLTFDEGALAARTLFRETFNADADGVWHAPGRVNIIGEHVDYNGGICLPIALPHRAFIAATPRSDRHVRLVSPQTRDHIDEFDLDTVDRRGTDGEVSGWAAYLVGVAWALEQAGFGPLRGFDAALHSCVPLGAGLSSSAALECAMAVAINDMEDLNLLGGDDDDAGRALLVDAARRAENDIAGANTGGLDQSASMRCTKGHALELDCRDMSVRSIPFDLAHDHLALLVIDTRAEHSHVTGEYAQRRQACEEAAGILGVDLLADIDDEQAALDQLPDEVMRARVRHVLTEIDRTRTFIDELASGSLVGERLDRCAALLDASHDSLRDDYEVTCPELDVAVDAARASGAHGARMTGGGFGGSAIALVDESAARDVARAVADAFAEHGFEASQFLIATPEEPAGKVAE